MRQANKSGEPMWRELWSLTESEKIVYRQLLHQRQMGIQGEFALPLNITVIPWTPHQFPVFLSWSSYVTHLIFSSVWLVLIRRPWVLGETMKDNNQQILEWKKWNPLYSKLPFQSHLWILSRTQQKKRQLSFKTNEISSIQLILKGCVGLCVCVSCSVVSDSLWPQGL